MQFVKTGEKNKKTTKCNLESDFRQQYMFRLLVAGRGKEPDLLSDVAFLFFGLTDLFRNIAFHLDVNSRLLWAAPANADLSLHYR